MNRQEAWVRFAVECIKSGKDAEVIAAFCDQMAYEFDKRFKEEEQCPVCGRGIPPAAGPMARGMVHIPCVDENRTCKTCRYSGRFPSEEPCHSCSLVMAASTTSRWEPKTEEIRQSAKATTLSHEHRWNVEKTDDGLKVCRGEHNKYQSCEWEYYVPRREADPEAVGKEEILTVIDRVSKVLGPGGNLKEYYDLYELNGRIQKHGVRP